MRDLCNNRDSHRSVRVTGNNTTYKSTRLNCVVPILNRYNTMESVILSLYHAISLATFIPAVITFHDIQLPYCHAFWRMCNCACSWKNAFWEINENCRCACIIYSGTGITVNFRCGYIWVGAHVHLLAHVPKSVTIPHFCALWNKHCMGIKTWSPWWHSG